MFLDIIEILHRWHPIETVTTKSGESSAVNWCNTYRRARCKGLVGIFCVYTVCTFYLLTLVFPAWPSQIKIILIAGAIEINVVIWGDIL